MKLKWWKFEPCLGTFTKVLVDGSSDTWLFRHLSNYVFRVRNFGNTKAVRVIFFFQLYKIEFRFQNSAKNSEKSFFFWENCISIGIVKLSLLWTGYFSSAANVLTGCPKIFHVNQRNFFQLNWLGSDHWKWQRCCDADLKSTSGSLPCCFSKVPLKRDFSDIYLTRFRSP